MAGIEKLVELAEQGQLSPEDAPETPERPPATTKGRRRKKGEAPVVVSPQTVAAIGRWVQAKPGGLMPKPPPLRRP